MVKLTTLSKAISITPRKTIFNRRLLIFLVFILTLCPLGAESWRYSILGENDEYVALIDSVISLMPYVDNVEACPYCHRSGYLMDLSDEDVALIDQEDKTDEGAAGYRLCEMVEHK